MSSSSGMTFNIFLSHSVEDYSIVSKIEEELKDKEIEVYIAEKDIQPGTSLAEKVRSNIEKCNLFIALITKNGRRSEWIQTEIGIALEAKKRIVPILEEGTNIPKPLKDLEYVELKLNDIEHSIDSLKAFLNKFKASVKKSLTKRLIGKIVLVLSAIIIIAVLASVFSDDKKRRW